MDIRAKILGLYGVVLLLAVIVSAQIFFSGKAIESTTNSLLGDNVPLLDDLSRIQQAVTETERSLYEYYATTDREVMLQQQAQCQEALQAALAHLHQQLPHEPTLVDIDRHLATMEQLARELDNTLSPSRVDWDRARELLVLLTEQGRLLMPLLSKLQAKVEAAVLGTADIVRANTIQTTNLVLIFSVLVLVVAALVAFYLDRFISVAAERSFLAFNDPLTRLPNRQRFDEKALELTRELPGDDSGDSVLLGIIKLDRFNLVTAGHGYSVGDALVKAAAERLHGLLPEQGHLFRFEGASFGFTLCDRNGVDWVEQLPAAFHAPLLVNGAEFYLTISVGYCLASEQACDGTTLIKNADASLSRAVDSGGDKTLQYNPELQKHEQSWLAMESELRQALRNQEFLLHYQPQVVAASGEVIGMEALIRWQSPTRGMVPPFEFIPLAEQTGLIVKIGDWVVREACRQAKAWQQLFGRRCVVAVNISPKQFLHRDFISTVERVLTETGVEPSLIEFEITEGVMVENTEHCIAMLEQLKAMGLQLSIDDFGTGYSSLSYLKRFCVDKLKVDQAFVRNLTDKSKDAAIVRTIIDMSHNLGLKVIAEGVETHDQRELLCRYGCEELQGYLIGKPEQPGHWMKVLQQNHIAI